MKKITAVFVFSINIISLNAHDVFNDALMEAISNENYALAVALYAEISKVPEDKTAVTQFITSAFKITFKQSLDDAAQAVIQFNQQLAEADKDEKQLRELFIDLMTNPQQPGGKIADKLGINKTTLISAIS